MVAATVCLAKVKRPICFAAANVVTCLIIKTHISLRFRSVSCQCTLSQVMVLGALLALWSMWLHASGFSGHSDLLVASAAKETEYMRESAAVSEAAFLLDGQTDLLPAPAAKAFHYVECQNVKQTLQAAAAAAAILVRSPFVAIVFTCPSGAAFFSGTVVKYTLKRHACIFRQGEQTRMHIKEEPRILLFLRPPGFDPGGFRRGQWLRRRC